MDTKNKEDCSLINKIKEISNSEDDEEEDEKEKEDKKEKTAKKTSHPVEKEECEKPLMKKFDPRRTTFTFYDGSFFNGFVIFIKTLFIYQQFLQYSRQ